MTIALSTNNKLGFIDGLISRPNDTDLNLLYSWIHNKDILISWILNSLSKEISTIILFSDSTFEIWIDLRDRFSNVMVLGFKLGRDLLNHFRNQQSVSVYFSKLKALLEELSNFRPICTCGKFSCDGDKDLISYFQMEYVMSFLMGLSDLA